MIAKAGKRSGGRASSESFREDGFVMYNNICTRRSLGLFTSGTTKLNLGTY